jgi:hypothetical protein
VYNLKGFVHPGGNSIIQFMVGREIDRYIFGGHSFELSLEKLPHIHTAYASAFLSRRFIGEINLSLFIKTKDDIIQKTSEIEYSQIRE